MRGGGTGRHGGVVRALQTVSDRNLSGSDIGDEHRDEERADPPRPLLEEDLVRLLDERQAADNLRAMLRLARERGVVKRTYCHETNDEALKAKVTADLFDKCYEIVRQRITNKLERTAAFEALRNQYIESYKADHAGDEGLNLVQHEKMIKRYYHDVEKEAMRRMVLDEGIRLDGRGTRDIRPIWCEVDYLPGAHGSAVLRGERPRHWLPQPSEPKWMRRSSTG